MSFKDDIKISLDSLDQAAIDQVGLYEEWSTKWADAVLQRDKLKEKLSVAKAEADDEIRKSPHKFGWVAEKSPTETWVANQVILHPEVRKLIEESLDSQYDLNIAVTGKEVLDHRKKSLEILTTLYSSNYFVAKSRTGENYVEALTKKGAEEQEKKIEESMKRRRREA